MQGTKTNENEHGHGHPTPETPTGTTDINFRAVIKFAMWMSVAALFIHGTMWVLFRYYLDAPEAPRPQLPSALANKGTRTPPKPQLQEDPIKELQNFRSIEEKTIKEGKVDPTTQAEGMPIEKAEELVLQKGLPTRQLADNQNAPDYELREDSSAGRNPEKRVRW